MSATAIPVMPRSNIDTSGLLRQRMLDTGYSHRDIAKIESGLLCARLHDTYLRAGYSPDDIAAVTSLY